MFKIFRAETSDVFPGLTPRNKAAIDYEQFIHRTFYPYIIHPYSRFRVYYEIVFLILIPCESFFFFFVWFSFPHNTVLYQLLTCTVHFFNSIDIIFRFFTGYVEQNTEIVVLDPKKIARKYVLQHFIVDIPPAFPWELFVYLLYRECSLREVKNIYCIVFPLFPLFSLLLKFVTFSRYSKNTSRIFCWNPFLPGILCIPYFYIQIILTQLGFSLAVEHNFGTSNIHVSVFDVFAWFSFDIVFIGTAFPVVNAPSQILILSASFIASICFTSYLIRYILGRMKLKENVFLVESRVKCFARKKHLPILLKHKTLLYIHILQQNKYHKEEEIFQHIPDTFKADIFFHFCLPLLKGFYAFEDFPMYVLRRLAERLKYQLYLPNQRIVRKDDHKLNMYFIQRGAVALYSSKNVELYHFETGSSINGRYMVEGKPNNDYYVISIEVTEVYCLSHKDFVEIMEAHPKYMDQVKKKLNLDEARSGSLNASVFK